MNEREQRFVDSAKKVLNASLTIMDEKTLARLGQSRRRALAAAGAPESGGIMAFWARFLPWPLVMAGGGSLIAAVLLVVFFVVRDPLPRSGEDNAMLAEISLFTAEESLEFFQDIDFYEWLSDFDEEEPATSGTGSAGDLSLAARAAIRVEPDAAPTIGGSGGGLVGVSRVICRPGFRVG